jgi:ElaB/YqjD/DUF883 family membrane-anchored ribosome-binding protein
MITKGSPMAQHDANSTRDYTGNTKRAAENAEEMAGTVTEQAREYGEKARDAVQQAKPFVEKSLREQPLITLAGVAAVGFLLGALWKK